MKEVKQVSALEKAKEEVRAEREKKAVEKFKIKLKELDAAQTIVKNLEREIADLEQEIEQGNF